jgi:hypothetical protein
MRWSAVFGATILFVCLSPTAGAFVHLGGGIAHLREARHPVTPARPDPASEQLRGKASEMFYWVGVLTGPLLVCDVRVGVWPRPWMGETGHELGQRLGIPLWVLERLNPGRDLSRLAYSAAVRVPAVRAGISRRCFTPSREWRMVDEHPAS